MHRDLDLESLLSRQIHRSGKACHMRDIATAGGTHPPLDRVAARPLCLLEDFDANVAELVAAGPDAVAVRF